MVAAAAAAGVVGAVVMRRWDRQAGKQVAELTRSRTSAEWRHEERIAELESDLEESRELRTKLEHKIRSKRGELAGLRNEHAALLRRYATAETERATALEGRRQLAIEASAPARALPPARSSALPVLPAPVPVVAPRPTPSVVPTPTLYRRANGALDRLTRRTTPAASAAPEVDEPSGKPSAADQHVRVSGTAAGTRGGISVPVAASVVQPAPTRRPVVEGSFDFFGMAKGEAPDRATIEAVQNEDLADVVGAEALAVHKAEEEGEFKQPTPQDADADNKAVGQVIDLTAHDETEQIDVAELRTALRA